MDGSSKNENNSTDFYGSLKADSVKLFGDMWNWLKSAFVVDLEKIYKRPENAEEERRIRRIRIFNLTEFLLTLFGIFGLMWTLWWQGIITGNEDMMRLSWILIGIIGIWALFISPFVHYFVERGITYRKGYLGLDYEQNAWTAWFEERGFGSPARYLKMLREGGNRKLINMMTLIVLMTFLLWMLNEFDNTVRTFSSFFNDDTLALYSTVTAVSLIYGFLAASIGIYSTYMAFTWENTGDKDLIKRCGLVGFGWLTAFSSVVFYWLYGVRFDKSGLWSSRWADPVVMYQSTFDHLFDPSDPAWVTLGGFGLIFIALFFVLKYFALGILIRFDNLKTSFRQLVFVSILATVIIFILWEIMRLPQINDYILAHQSDKMGSVPYAERLWYIFEDTADESMRTFTFGILITNWSYYIYWGLLQELLFLGYWCTLLTKVFKNKYVNALLSASCFGFIHYPSWPLMLLTMFGGFFWAIAWQRNDSRNLFIMGAIHGFAGTLVSKMIPIKMSVGPSNMG